MWKALKITSYWRWLKLSQNDKEKKKKEASKVILDNKVINRFITNDKERSFNREKNIF